MDKIRQQVFTNLKWCVLAQWLVYNALKEMMDQWSRSERKHFSSKHAIGLIVISNCGVLDFELWTVACFGEITKLQLVCQFCCMAMILLSYPRYIYLPSGLTFSGHGRDCLGHRLRKSMRVILNPASNVLAIVLL